MNIIARAVGACWRIEMRMWNAIKSGVDRTVAAYGILLLGSLVLAAAAAAQASAGERGAAAWTVVVLVATVLVGVAITPRRR